MPGELQPLDSKFAIVGPDGRPTLYFTQWAQQRQIDISGGITADDAQTLINDWAAHRQILAGRALDGGGFLSGDVTIDHAESLVVPGTYGSATMVPQLVVDQEGHVQGVTEVPITGGGGGGSFSGCRLGFSAAINITPADTPITINWNTETFDVGNWHESVTHPERITPPTGVTKCRVDAALIRDNNSSSYHIVYINHYNSAGVLKFTYRSSLSTGGVMAWVECTTGVVDVAAGDYFTIQGQSGSAGGAAQWTTVSWAAAYAIAGPVAAGTALALIGNVVAVGGETQLDIAVPNTYKDVIAVASLLGTTAIVADVILRVNNLATAIYNTHRVYGGSSASGSEALNQTGYGAGGASIYGITNVANDFAAGEFTFIDYAKTDRFKQVFGRCSYPNGVSVDSGWIVESKGKWKSTAAIAQINFLLSGGAFAAGSEIILYGRS
jgi:hypothetical protein